MSPGMYRAICQSLAVLEVVVICVLYARTINWRDGVARLVYALATILGVVCLLSFVRYVAHLPPDRGWYAWLSATVFTAIPFVLAWLLIVIISLNRKGRSSR